MPTSKSKSVILCSLISGLAALSGCSDSDPADVSFKEVDTSEVPTNIVPNSDLSQSSTEWTGWGAEVDETNGVLAEFALAPTLGEGGNSLKTSVANVEADSQPDDVVAGPSDVTVTPGQAYGVAAYVQGPTCGLTRFIVNPEGNTDPELYLADENIFLTGEPQMVEFYFQVPEGVNTIDMPVQMGFADNVGGEFFFDRIVAMPIPVMPQIEEGNVARNSNFEASDTDINVDGSWGQSGTGATFSLHTVPEDAQSGNNSVRVVFDENVGSGNPWDIEAGPIGVPVVSGWTYEFSAWFKGEPGAVVNFLIQNPTAYNVFAEQRVENFTDEWQEVRFEATITGTNVVRLYAQYNFPDNSNKTIYIDNIRLIPPDTCPYAATPPNLVSTNPALFEYNHVVNGGFEDDLLETLGWATTSDNGAAAQFEMQIVGDEINRTLVNNGYQSLKTTVTAVTNNPTDVQVGPADLYVVPGQTYIYSGFVRGPVGSEASFTTILPDAPSTSMEEVVVSFNNLWRQVTFDFVVPDTAPVLTPEELAEAGFAGDEVLTRLSMVVNLGYPENEGKHIYLDDFTLLPNAIRNGDLEDSANTAPGWTTHSASDYASFILDSTVAHTGTNSLRTNFGISVADAVEDEESGAQIFLISPDDVRTGIENISVAEGRRYFVSARVNGEAGSRLKLSVTTMDGTELASTGGGDEDEDGISDGVELGGGAQEITFPVNVPAGVNAVNLIAQMGYPTNALRTIYLDTFRLVSQIPPPPRAKANLVANSGLESGGTTGWNGNGATITAVNTANAVYSGRYGLHVTERSATWASAQYDLTDVGLEPGGNYFASAWVKVDGDASDVIGMTLQINYEGDGSDTDYVGIVNSGDADTLDWTRLSGVFTFAPDEGKTVTGIRVYIEASQAGTSYYIDDLFVTKVLNTNGGFETGDISGWQAAGATVAATMTDVRSGTYAAHVTGRTESWNSAQYDMRDIGLVPGRTYLISSWVKTDGVTAENIKMTMEYVDAGESPQYRTLAQSSDTLEWVQLSNTYTHIPDGDISTLKVYFEADSATGSYFIDDLIITEYVPPVSVITNGDLELGNTEGWVPSGATLAMATWPEGGAHTGFFGLRVADRTMNWNSAQYPLMELELESGTSYQASVWVKIASETGTSDTLNLTLLLNDGRANPYINVASATVTSDGWTQLVGTFDYAPTGDVTDLRLYIEASGATTSYFIDDLVVAPNFAANGGLEASSTVATGWNGAGATISLDTATKRFGERSLFVSGRTENWNSAQFDLTTSGMEPGKTYEISAWVKIEGDIADVIKMTLESRAAEAETSTYTLLDDASETMNWVKLSTQYVFGYEEMPEVFKVYFEANLPASSYYVDALVITEVDEIYTH